MADTDDSTDAPVPISKVTHERAVAAKLKLEKFYEQIMQQHLEREQRLVRFVADVERPYIIFASCFVGEKNLKGALQKRTLQKIGGRSVLWNLGKRSPIS